MGTVTEEAVCLLGWKAEKAEAFLRARGERVRVDITVPTVRQPVQGPLRVVRQEVRDGVFHLTACRVTDPYDE